MSIAVKPYGNRPILCTDFDIGIGTVRYNGRMRDSYNKLAHLLRTQPTVLMELERKMNSISGQEGVFEDIIRQNDITVDRTLAGLGMTRRDGPVEIRSALMERLAHLGEHLSDILDRPDMTKPAEACRKLCAVIGKVFTPPKGLFIKHEKAAQMLEQYPPHNLLEHFGYANARELLDKEGYSSVLASLRFTQSTEWMHQFFEIAYATLTPDDFEEREIEHIVLDVKWLGVAEKFMSKKYHNVSHLKEFGIIFIVPLITNGAGTMLRMFMLILHYLHEVPFYASLFRRHLHDPDFATTFKSLLRGDVPSGPAPNHGKIVWRIVQRYLAKDNADDFRLFEPHVSPEAAHWWHSEEDLGRLSRIMGKDHGRLDLGWWTGLDFVGEVFTDPRTGKEELVSFDLIDLLMSLVRISGSFYLYHQQEALWNKIFVEYMGRERMEELIAENIVSGFITL